MKATKQLITFYKAKVLEPIVNKLHCEGYDVSKEKIDTYLKSLCDLDKSSIEMSTEELQEVIERGFNFGQELGLQLDYPKDNLDDLIKMWK